MLTFLVKPLVVSIFDRIGRRDIDRVVAGLAPDVHHRFAGTHALGGERHRREDVRAWFERLYRLYPALDFDVRAVHCAGWPWALRITVEWTAELTPQHGPSYRNVGAHVIYLRGVRVAHLHPYEDSQAVVDALHIMAEAGIAEAAAAPIVS